MSNSFASPWTSPPPSLSSVNEISQARILEWVDTSFSLGSSWPRDRTCVSHISWQILYSWITGVKNSSEHGLISGYIVVSQIFWISEVFLTVGSKTEHFSMTPGFEAWLPKWMVIACTKIQNEKHFKEAVLTYKVYDTYVVSIRDV